MPGTTPIYGWTVPDPNDPVADEALTVEQGMVDAEDALAGHMTTRKHHAAGFGQFFPEVEGAGTGVDDTAAMQAAAAAAKALPGSVLHLKQGATYRISAEIEVTGLVVQMNGATIQIVDSVPDANGNPVAIAAPNILASSGDLTVVGPGLLHGNRENTTNPGTSAAGNGIYAANTVPGSKISIGGQLAVSDCWQRGISIASNVGGMTDAANAVTLPVVVDGVTVTNCNSYGIFVSEIAGPQIRNVVASGCSNGIYVQLCKFPTVSACDTFGNVGHGVVCSYCLEATVTAVTANGNGQSGIAFGGGSVNNVANKLGSITGCTCSDNTDNGISVDPTISGQPSVPVEWGGAITGNICKNNGIHGIGMTAVGRATITGNYCHGNTRNGVALNSSNLCSVSGNSLIGNANFGVGINAGSNAPSGFYGRHSVGSNICDGNSLGRVSTSSEQFHDPTTNTTVMFRETFGTVPPERGAWERGDRCWNTAPVASQSPIIGWVCITAGTPGTWRPLTPVEATGRAAATAPAGGGTVAVPITFPTGLFTPDIPVRVLVSITDSAEPEQTACSVSNITNTGCTIYIYRDRAASTAVAWHAIQGVEP